MIQMIQTSAALVTDNMIAERTHKSTLVPYKHFELEVFILLIFV